MRFNDPSLRVRFAETSVAPEYPTPVGLWLIACKTPEAGKFYARRKHTPERVSGKVKEDHVLELKAYVRAEGCIRRHGEHTCSRGDRAA
jgi:hypothetical protein